MSCCRQNNNDKCGPFGPICPVNECLRIYTWYYDCVKQTYEVVNPRSVRISDGYTYLTDEGGVVHVVPDIGRYGCTVRIFADWSA